MRVLSTVARAVLVTSAALVTVAATAAPAAAQATPERFFADFRDDCVYAYTEGTLTWPDPNSTSTRPGVTVRGVVAERNACETTDRNVFAEFTAYVGRTQVDHQVEYTRPPVWRPGPDPSQSFSFVLTNSVSRDPIDRVEVRVCRDFGPWLPAFTCGDTSTYFPPAFIPHPPLPPIS